MIRRPTRRRIGWLLRRLADRIDRAGAPKSTGLAFTFEPGRGLVVNATGNSNRRVGTALWYLNDDDRERAHTDSIGDGGVVVDLNEPIREWM